MVAVSTDLMTSPDPDFGVIDVPSIKHIWLVGTNGAMVQGIMAPHAKERLMAASRRMRITISWFETREDALLTMRN
jgi:hypothetical protein